MKTMPIYIIMSLMSALPEAAQAQDNCLMSPHRAICKTETVKLYVGPQSVEPGEDIFIAVETLTGSLESSSAKTVTIIDADSGQQYQAPVNRGLAYIEITAPSRAGRIVFTAKSGDEISAPAEVLVHAGPAANVDLFIEKNKGQIFLSSSIIADGFGNILDDGMTVELDLISGSQVYSSMLTRTQNGRIGVHIACESIRFANTQVRAKIGQISSELELPSYICGAA